MSEMNDGTKDVAPAASKEQPCAPAILVEGLAFSYPHAEAPVLHSLDWEVPRGAFAILVGGTGSGKSTLLSLLKPQIAPAGIREGSLAVGGVDVDRLDDAQSARSIGYVFQNPDNQIVCESVWHEMAFCLENLGTPQDEMRRLIAETSYFFGIDDWFRQSTDSLSGGRKQLLALASTLVAQPSLLLLDEPTSQLDPVAERNFLHALFRINRELGCTVVVATHAPRAMVDYATCAFELVDGQVREILDMEALRMREPLVDAGKTVPPRVQGKDAPCALTFDDAWFRYDRESPWVLRNLDLRVAKAQIHALVGGNGCGKSTLLTLAAGSSRLQRGKLRIGDGRRVLLPQDPRALFAAETTLDELMEWSGRLGYGEEEAHRLLEKLGLTAQGRVHPYDLSGGQQQLLAIGKLLLAKPDALLLDEPTKGLDAQARSKVAHVLLDLRAQGKTVLMASHDLDFVQQVADTVSMMFDGEIASTEPVTTFFANNVYYRP